MSVRDALQQVNDEELLVAAEGQDLVEELLDLVQVLSMINEA